MTAFSDALIRLGALSVDSPARHVLNDCSRHERSRGEPVDDTCERLLEPCARARRPKAEANGAWLMIAYCKNSREPLISTPCDRICATKASEDQRGGS